MSQTKIENARISGTMLGREDHGIMTAFVHLEGDGWGVGFGGYGLDQWDDAGRKRLGSAYGMAFIAAVLDVVGVTTWEQLTGQHVRVESEGWGGKARRLGHITKDKWFDPVALAEEYRTRDKCEAVRS